MVRKNVCFYLYTFSFFAFICTFAKSLYVCAVKNADKYIQNCVSLLLDYYLIHRFSTVFMRPKMIEKHQVTVFAKLAASMGVGMGKGGERAKRAVDSFPEIVLTN